MERPLQWPLHSVPLELHSRALARDAAPLCDPGQTVMGLVRHVLHLYSMHRSMLVTPQEEDVVFAGSGACEYILFIIYL